jgi:PAS domain S-box-containing protein
MFPVGSRSLRAVAVGEESLGESLSGWDDGAGRSLDVEVVDPDGRVDAVAGREVDCLIVDGSLPTVDGAAVVRRWTEERPGAAVVLLVDGGDDERVAEALSAGVTETLPRGLVGTEPALLAERVVSAVEREHARTTAGELYDTVAGVATLHDPESGELLHANRAFRDLAGCDRGAVRSMEVEDFTADVPGYDRERVTNVVSSVTDRDGTVEVEWPLRTADGAVRWIESQLHPVRVGGREVVLSASVDVTERRRQERKYEEVFDGVNDAISIHDPWAEEMLDVNERMTGLTGYSRGTLLEMDVDGLGVAEGGFAGDRGYGIQQRVAATGEGETVEWVVETAGGERRLLETTLTPATIAGEDRVLALSRDVTERREYERRLERERDRRSVLFENNPDPVLRVRFEAGEPTIREVNPAFEEVFGFPPEEVVGSTVAEAVVPESERAAHERLRARVARRERVEAVAPRRTADGTREFLFRVIHFSTDPDAETATDAYVWYTDVTERKRRERLVRRLHESTEDVRTAGTVEEVCAATVDAARDVLGLSAPTCWLADDDGGRLRPVAGAEDELVLPGGSPEPPGIHPDDPAYGAYEEGEPRAFGPDDPSAAAGTDPAVVVPLGGYGLLGAAGSGSGSGAGAGSDGFDDVALDAVGILARHAATALERVERERERREHERRFRLIAERIDEVIFLSEPDFSELFYVNDAYEEIWGEPVETLYDDPRGFVERIDPRDREAFEADFEAMLADIERGEADDSYVFEYRVRPADGGVRWVRATGYPVADDGDGDHESGFVGIVEDVTERKRREREYEQIFDGVNDSIVVQDPETAQPLDANRTFLDRLGYDSVEEIRDAGFAALSATEEGFTTERAREICRRVAETGEPETGEWQQETKSGDRRWIEATVDAAEIGGEERILSLQRDVTERKRRERMIRALHESMDDLQDAETREEVCAAAVDAATEVLDLGRPTCWLHGVDGTDALVPVAGAAAGPDAPADGGFGALEPGDREYGVYDSGEHGTVAPDELDGGTPPGDVALFALGEHGLFGAVEGDADEFEDVRLDVAGILARHVTSALDRVERERELRESERRFRLIADHIDEIVYLATADFSEIVYINDAYEEIYGRPVSELAEDPTSFVEAAHPEDRERYEADVERLVADLEAGEPREAYGGEYRIERDGETRWVAVTRFPVENEAGTVDRIVGRVQDVTERKRREREYEQIYNGVNDSITVHDPETAELLDVNDTFCELLGHDREEILEMGVEGYSPSDERFTMAQAREFVREVLDADEPRRTEWAVETSDGDTRWLDVKGTTVEIGGELRYVSINRDVTERRRTERRLGEILDRIDEAIFIARAAEMTSASQDPDYVSSGYEEIWGRSLDAIRETYEEGFFATLHPDDAGEYRAFVEGIVDDIDDGTAADSYSHEYRIERPDGGTRWVRSDYYPAAWESGPPRIVIVTRDVTGRKRRERRIASFDDATDDLATADTPEEATRTAVEAAADTLELPAVGAFLYDGEDGVLRPEVLAGPLPEDVTAEPIGPGDGPLWEGFATGTIVASDGGRREPGFVGEGVEDGSPEGLDGLTGWRALSLGTHGILLVGSPEGSLGSETVQAAHVLAATLEAALNHLGAERRLEAREEALRTQTERAERLDRIARLTQRVEAAITDASNPGEVERAVCERLVGTGPYDLAWVGGVDVGSDQLTPRAVVGAPDQYVEALTLTTADDTADPHPAVEAWQTDAVRVEESLVGDGPTDDWRRRSLSRGYQSLCAVPLTYDGITHGVLTVGIDSPNAFSEREREVLSQLGTSIANALAAIERRRALESDETVELEFRGTGEALSFARAADAADCRVALERTVVRQDGSASVYFSFEGDVPEDAAEVASRTLPGAVDVVTERSSSTLVEASTDDWFGAPLAEYGGVLREASAEPGETTVLVEVPTQADVRSFVERLREVAPSLELVARRQHRRRDRTPAELSDRVRAELTDRQFEVVETALSAGYFEWPREHDGGEVAARLDITQPTFNKHLRIAERKTFELLFGADE